MMKRLLALALVGLLAGGAWADGDDRVMGVYEGAFSGDAGNIEGLEAKVAGLGNNTWKLVLYFSDASGAETRVEMEGKAEAPRKPVQFDGELDLGALGGKAKLTARLEKRVLKGTLTLGTGSPAAFALKQTVRKPESLGKMPPPGAKVLFNGTDLSGWRRDPEGWCIQPDGSMQVCGSSLRTIEELGSGLYHLEFMTPYMPNEREQGRGNSGVYILGRYEVQVLDNFGWEPKWDLCGGIYKVAIPLVDATLPPLTWQTYDITFTAAKFDAAGAKTDNARITVVHNGVTVHDNLELPQPTPGGVAGQDATTGPLLLQDHHNEVKFKNIWFAPAAK